MNFDALIISQHYISFNHFLNIARDIKLTLSHITRRCAPFNPTLFAPPLNFRKLWEFVAV